MADSGKRKGAPGGGRDGGSGKRSKGGTNNKWQTPHQQVKAGTPRNGGKIEPGDVGIWASCMKGKEGKATEELKHLFDEYAEKIYGVSSSTFNSDTKDGESEEEEEDIEASIRKEMASLEESKKSQTKLFSPVFLDVQCVLFFKMRAPIQPVEFVQKILEDAAAGAVRKHRFLNRLTPATLVGKASEGAVKELARTVLGKDFELAEEKREDGENAPESEDKGEKKPESPGCSFAIRPTIRNHSTLKRDAIIKQIASLVGPSHRVNLTNPDKVILVEIYQTICTISVVPGPAFEALKRFNINEIYTPTEERKKEAAPSLEAKPKTKESGKLSETAETAENVEEAPKAE